MKNTNKKDGKNSLVRVLVFNISFRHIFFFFFYLDGHFSDDSSWPVDSDFDSKRNSARDLKKVEQSSKKFKLFLTINSFFFCFQSSFHFR